MKGSSARGSLVSSYLLLLLGTQIPVYKLLYFSVLRSLILLLFSKALISKQDPSFSTQQIRS